MIFKIIISIVIGAVIGLERASPQKLSGDKKSKIEPHEVGVRTFSLISLLGVFSGLVMENFLIVSIIISISFCILAITYYILQTLVSRDSGITTELALLFTYVIGLAIGRDILPVQIILMIAVFLVLVLSRKAEIQNLILGIQRNEINAFISYALIALVILPFLPNTNYSFSDIPSATEFLKNLGINIGRFADLDLINPFKLWFIVALITGIDVVGYILERTIGQKGKLMSSLAGGFISSTATTQALALESKRHTAVGQQVGAALYANMVSFIPVFFLIGSVNTNFLVRLIPVILSIIVACGLTASYFYFYHQEKDTVLHKKTEETSKVKEIFNLGSALTFVLIFTIVKIVSEIALVIFGSQGAIITTSLAALTGIDAAILTVSQMAGTQLSYTIGIWTFILINSVNLIAKTFYSFLSGSRPFAVRFGLSVILIIGSSVIWPLLFNR